MKQPLFWKKNLAICLVYGVWMTAVVASSLADYCVADTKGKWTGTGVMRIVTSGITTEVMAVSFQFEDVTSICLMNGGLSPSGVDPSTNIPALDGTFTNHSAFNFSGYLNGHLDFDIYGAWHLNSAGVFSSTAYMHEYGELSSYDLPPRSVDLHFDFATDARFINPSRFEANSSCIMTGKFYGVDMRSEVYYEFVVTRSLVVTGDFDGDGRSDSAMVDVEGNWYIWFSSNNHQRQGPFALGLMGGTPIAADFDGDGKTDPAIVDAAGHWHIWYSSSNYQHQGPFNLGLTGGKPISADFDGDGKADPAIADNNGNWHVWVSSAGYQRFDLALASPAGIRIAADFDGDGKADPAVYEGGNWHVYFSAANYIHSGPYALGAISGMAAAMDYDGDGKADPVIVDGAENWHVWVSSGNYQHVGPFPWTAP